MMCAVLVGQYRPQDVISKIRDCILGSDLPEAVEYMRGISAIRQSLSR
jgi:hypothetical protein